jgi:hypothetical protein
MLIPRVRDENGQGWNRHWIENVLIPANTSNKYTRRASTGTTPRFPGLR